MTDEQRTIYTRKIAQSNRSELIVILYEIFFSYTKEGKEANENNDTETARTAFRGASQVLEHLKNALDFRYETANNLYRLYDFAERQIARGNYTGKNEAVCAAEKVMTSLKEAFEAVAKEDHSAPMMQNAQSIVAGITYGRQDVTENMENYDSSRGFLV